MPRTPALRGLAEGERVKRPYATYGPANLRLTDHLDRTAAVIDQKRQQFGLGV